MTTHLDAITLVEQAMNTVPNAIMLELFAGVALTTIGLLFWILAIVRLLAYVSLRIR